MAYKSAQSIGKLNTECGNFHVIYHLDSRKLSPTVEEISRDFFLGVPDEIVSGTVSGYGKPQFLRPEGEYSYIEYPIPQPILVEEII